MKEILPNTKKVMTRREAGTRTRVAFAGIICSMLAAFDLNQVSIETKKQVEEAFSTEPMSDPLDNNQIDFSTRRLLYEKIKNEQFFRRELRDKMLVLTGLAVAVIAIPKSEVDSKKMERD